LFKEKQSVASKKAELNRKGLEKEKKGDNMPEVFTAAAAKKPEQLQPQQQQQPPDTEKPPVPARPAPEPLIEVSPSHIPDQCCGSGMFYPGSGSLTFLSRIRIPNLGGGGSTGSRIPDPTVQKNRDEI
jgi:hypothetical protein